jgi:hypothetical protein
MIRAYEHEDLNARMIFWRVIYGYRLTGLLPDGGTLVKALSLPSAKLRFNTTPEPMNPKPESSDR